ncbi:type I 3-dehydroquinate dehydratase [Bacillus sp. JJ1764]|uniref:type I 3-dehydroquinate dehydratase n=1 Tax=Bacillus sp. JJ1764 TaxID=3122964 RepID=UPI002FFDA0D3
MKKTITVKNVTLGEGRPKVCVSMTGKSQSELIQEAEYFKTLDLDLVEWRVDFFEQFEDLIKVRETLQEIRIILSNLPLIFTFRSKKEGGEKEISSQYYVELNTTIAETCLVDFIDIELFNNERTVKTLTDTAHSNGVFVIISNHDFSKTPPKEEIIERLCKAQEFGADIPKIALMPSDAADVLSLLEATNIFNEQYSDRPFITISMGKHGIISRAAGGMFGVAMTFAAAKNVSAPGQIPVSKLKEIIEIFH